MTENLTAKCSVGKFCIVQNEKKKQIEFHSNKAEENIQTQETKSIRFSLTKFFMVSTFAAHF